MALQPLPLLVLSGFLAGSSPVGAQVWRGVHRDAERPDYVRELTQISGPDIDMPLPPFGETSPLDAASGASRSESGRPWRGIHRDTERPDYLSDIIPPNLQPIHLPPPPVGEAPPVVRGLYVNAWVFGGKRFYDLVRLADTTEVNAFIIDVKDGTGYLTYRSSVPIAIEVGANGLVRARDVRKRLELLNERGIHPIARIVVAKDPLLANGRPNWAVSHQDGGYWTDRLGHHWVDAYRDSVWLYAADIAEEAVLMGFAEVQFDYIRFPDEPAALLDKAIFPARRMGQSRRNAVTTNLAKVRDRVKAMGVPFTVDVFGLTTSARSDMGIGQYWEDVSDLADVVLPMVYPSHYNRGAYGLTFPNAEPYAVVRRALEDGLKRNAAIRNAARIRPYLQSFSIRRVRYTATEIRAQMDAVYDVGLTDWVLWNASGRYPADAFLPNGRSSVALPAQFDQPIR